MGNCKPESAESFDTRFNRLVDLLRRLSQPQGYTAKQMCKVYGLSERTILRDFDLLRRANYPLEELGRSRGYRLSPAFRFPPQALKASDILPMVLGERLLGEEGYQVALSKLLNFVVNGVERQLTLELPGRVVSSSQHDRGLGWLEPIAGAIVRRRQVLLRYQSTHESSESERLVEPTTLVVRSAVWYFEAFDHRSAQHKTFRLSRVTGCELLGSDQVQPLPPPSSEPFHTWDLSEEPPVQAVLQVRAELAAWLRENPAHPSQQMEGERVTYQVRSRSPFLRWVLGLEGARLLEPTSLLEELKVRIQSLSDSYSSKRIGQ